MLWPIGLTRSMHGGRGDRMLGTITRFSKLTTSGAIRSEQGENFDFDLAGVLTYDVAALAEE